MASEDPMAPPMVHRLRKLPPDILLSRACFVLLVATVLLVGAICLLKAADWINRPFPGFLINQRMVINGMGRYHWTGTTAGLKHPDKILTANGQPVVTSHDLERIILPTPVGQPIRYTVEQDGRVVTLDIPTMRFNVADFVVLVGTLFLTGLIYLAIGVIVFVLKPDTRVSWSHLLLCLCLSAFNLTAFDVAATHAGFVRWYFSVTAFLPAAGVHLSMLFPEPWKIVDRRPWVQLLPYGLAAVLLIPVEAFYPGPVFIAAYNLLYVYLIVGALAILGSSLVSYLWESSVIAKQRSKVVLFGAAVAFPLPALGELAFYRGWTFQGIPIQANFLAIPILMFPAAIAYAIAKHNLFDVDVYIKRTVGYGTMTAVVALTYFALQTLVNALVLQPVFGAQSESIYPIIFALLVVFFFNPVNRRVQEGVEKLFFRKPYDYKTTIASIGDALTSLVDLDAMLIKVISIIRAQLFLDRVGVVVLDPGTQTCQYVFFGDPVESASRSVQRASPRHDDPLLSVLGREKRLITKYDIAEDPRFEPVRESCGRSFAEFGASVAVPLLYQESFAGMLAVGYKKSGHFYSRDDIDLLKTASTMTATAIEQAHEKEQRGTLMQLFSKHVAPEVAEVLWQQREQFLDGGRPRSQKQIVTVMFTDLQGFTSVSEQLDPQVLMDWLNTYMDGIARTVMDHGGVVDDYFGDGVKVNFGVPVPRTSEEEIRQDALHAVRCALALEREMARINENMKARGLPNLRMRVGIYTGPVVAGTLGSAERMKYTTLGDTVNTAARLESYDKDLFLPHFGNSPCRILIGESTLLHLGDRFETQKVGELTLKGKETRVTVHCVLGQRGEVESSPEVPAPQV